MIIDDHVHVGIEVTGPKNLRKLWYTRKRILEHPEEKVYDTMGMRHFFVKAGRWDPKYLDPLSEPPYTIDDLIYTMDDAGIDKGVLIGRDYQQPWPPYIHMVADADYVAHFVDKYPDRLVGTGPMNPYEMNAYTKIKYYVEDLHLHGAGEVYCPTGIDPADRKLMYPIYEACVEYDIPIFEHIAIGGLVGKPQYSTISIGGSGGMRRNLPPGNYPYGNPRRLEEVGLDFPDLKLMQHLYGMLEGPVGQLCKKFPNFRTHAVYNPRSCSGEREKASKEWILWCQDNIPDQVMMGSDYVWGFPQKLMVKWIQNLPGLTNEFKTKLFETNPRKWYKF